VTDPAQPLTARRRALIALADELTPAKSLVRLDAATARVVTTVSVVGTLLTGFGLLAAGLPTLGGAARAFAVVSMVFAFFAVLSALTAQILTITRSLNTNNLKDVERWYQRRFQTRAPLTRAAGVLLVVAVAAAGVAAVLAIARSDPDRASMAVSRAGEAAAPSPSGSASAEPVDTVTVDVTFRGLEGGQVATVTVTVDDRVVARAAVAPTQDGVATRTLSVEKVPATATVTVDATAGDAGCTADGQPGEPVLLMCKAA
jgi:hypothetical protein